MAELTAKERFFCERVRALALCNHFDETRLPLMRELLGDEYVDGGGRWHWQWSSGETEDPNLERLCERTDATLAAIHSRVTKQGEVLSTVKDAQLYQGLIWWVLYHRLRDEMLALVKAEQDTAKQVNCRKTYDRFSATYEKLLEIVDDQAEGRTPAAHLFALFYQLRRAFFHIFYYMVGGSTVAGRLRSAVWESIFTHDRGRYMRSLYLRLGQVPTLITGETGTGKELIARAIACSRYIPYDESSGTFAANYASSIHPLNLSALSQTLLESELFGHRRGSFTGATADRVGYLEASGPLGTVFLDEIGELDVTLQVKLLRVLEDRRFNRIGDVESLPFEGKIIAATNRNLADEIEEGAFRTDLYYRLCADQIRSPSLREQLQESPQELENAILFIARREAGPEEAKQLTSETMAYVERELGLNYPWPGNFRELGQCVRNVLVRNQYRPLRRRPRGAMTSMHEGIEDGSLTVAELLRHYVSRIHAETDNYLETARRLGIDHRTVRRHLDDDLIAEYRGA